MQKSMQRAAWKTMLLCRRGWVSLYSRNKDIVLAEQPTATAMDVGEAGTGHVENNSGGGDGGGWGQRGGVP